MDVQQNARKLACSISKIVNSHNVIDIQADVVHQRMSNLPYSVERG